jgi:glycosyltransferase involved in cell wall biosynthesis
MKVLYISHHRQRSGSGEAARNYIRALCSVGIEVSARPILLQGDLDVKDLPEDIRKAEETSSEGSEVCIQHVLPHYLDYNGNFRKNIAVLITETIGWENSGWAHYVNTMDEVWVPNLDAKDAKYDSEITPPVKIIPHACDINRYDNVKPAVIPELEGGYTFYYIGEHNRRKRISAFVEAFHLEFASNEPVNILLKVYQPNKPGHETFNEVVQLCNQIKTGLKLYQDTSRYHNELIMANYMSDSELLSLHKACDCFVLSSYGEAWSYPAFDAMALGKSVIAPAVGGPEEYLDDGNNAYLVEGEYVPCIGSMDTFNYLNTGREKWYSIDINNLRWAMREMFNKRELREAYRPNHRDYSFEKIGKRMVEAINEN